MLQIKGVSLSINKNFRELVRDFTFSLNEGDRAVIVGEEGSGKSTLLKFIYDESLVDSYAAWTGEVQRDGMRMGYLAQELSEDEKALTVHDYMSQSTAFYALLPNELAEIAARLGLPVDIFFADRAVGTLSGGEKVKLQMARILCEGPDVLLLDEPTNDIDIETIRWLEDFLGRSAAPVIYISHDETLIERTANVVIHMEQVRKKQLPRHTVARMPYREYVDTRLAAFAHQEQVARKEEADYRRRMERWRKIYDSVDYQSTNISRAERDGKARLLKKKMKSVLSQERRFEREHEDATQMPDTEEAIFFDFMAGTVIPTSKRILDLNLPELRIGDRLLSRNVRLEIYGPRQVGIIGANGVGKTTLLRRIADELLPRRDIVAGYMPQDYAERLDMLGSPVDYLSQGRTREEITRARTYLGSMRYTADEMTGKITELSGGQKAKLFFLNLEIAACNVLILDEPTRNFSPLSNPVIRGALARFPGVIISVSHDRKYLREVCDTVYRLTGDGLQLVGEGELE